MIDFLKIFPNVSKDEYLWDFTIPQIELASVDFTRIEYIDDDSSNSNGGKTELIPNVQNLSADAAAVALTEIMNK